MDGKRWFDDEAMHGPDHVSDSHGGAPGIGARADARWLSQMLAGVLSVHHAHAPGIALT